MMKILQVYDKRKVLGGADHGVDTTIDILQWKGEQVVSWIRLNEELMSGLSGKVKGFFSGIYSRSARYAIKPMRWLIRGSKCIEKLFNGCYTIHKI